MRTQENGRAAGANLAIGHDKAGNVRLFFGAQPIGHLSVFAAREMADAMPRGSTLGRLLRHSAVLASRVRAGGAL